MHELTHMCLWAASPTAEELAAKQQQTLHALWAKPKRLTPQQQLAEMSPAMQPATYLTPKAGGAAVRTSNLKPKNQTSSNRGVQPQVRPRLITYVDPTS